MKKSLKDQTDEELRETTYRAITKRKLTGFQEDARTVYSKLVDPVNKELVKSMIDINLVKELINYESNSRRNQSINS